MGTIKCFLELADIIYRSLYKGFMMILGEKNVMNTSAFIPYSHKCFHQN